MIAFKFNAICLVFYVGLPTNILFINYIYDFVCAKRYRKSKRFFKVHIMGGKLDLNVEYEYSFDKCVDVL